MQTKIRVLHIAQAAGGVDRYLRSLLKYFDREKFENILLCSYYFKKDDYDDITDDFIQINMQRKISAKHDLSSVRQIRKVIKSLKPDVVYMHSSKAGAIGRIADLGISNVRIYNPHGWAFNMDCGKKKQAMYRIIEKMLALFTTQFVCISEAEKESAVQNKIANAKKFNVILNGIDIENCNKQLNNGIPRKKIGIPDDAFVIGQIGRISKQKSPDVFIRAAAKIKDAIPNAYFMLVGDGDMKDGILQYAIENGIDDPLKITGWVENPLSYATVFDVAALLSRWEGFGLVLPEYMLAQKPIVACETDAIPTLIDNRVNGLLVPVESPQAVCDAVTELYNNSQLRTQLIENGKIEVYEKFDAQRVSDEHKKLIFNLLCDKKK